MIAVRVHRFGGLDSLVVEDVPRPEPAAGEVLVRVQAAGVGPWDAWIRDGRSALPQPLPLTLGSDLAGIVESAGPGVSAFHRGDEVFGVTNSRFTGAYAEYAVASAAMLARKPARLGFIAAASVPVVATTAWQMVFEHAQVGSGDRVVVHGAAGNVGAYAVQFAKSAAAEVTATAFSRDLDYVRSLGADRVIDPRAQRFDDVLADLDVVLDTVGGETLDRSFGVLKRGGVLVSSAAVPDSELAARGGVRAMFFLVEVTTARLARIAECLDAGRLVPCVGDVLPMRDVRLGHEMLGGKPHRRGKIVLAVNPSIQGETC